MGTAHRIGSRAASNDPNALAHRTTVPSLEALGNVVSERIVKHLMHRSWLPM
jgi:hypothetical protein